jgi:hypothetical protein
MQPFEEELVRIMTEYRDTYDADKRKELMFEYNKIFTENVYASVSLWVVTASVCPSASERAARSPGVYVHLGGRRHSAGYAVDPEGDAAPAEPARIPYLNIRNKFT